MKVLVTDRKNLRINKPDLNILGMKILIFKQLPNKGDYVKLGEEFLEVEFVAFIPEDDDFDAIISLKRDEDHEWNE